MLIRGVIHDQIDDHPDATITGYPYKIDRVARCAQA
jgi:hypothetical protein